MRKVNWGVLGTAGIAEGQTIPGMREAENCGLYAIAGRNPEKVRAFQEKFGFEKGYTSYEELLDDPQVEAVYIPLPNHLHCEWVMKALQKKKHVLCEKPLAGNTEDMRRMLETAEENGVYLMEAFAYLHSPFIRAMKADLDAGVIGDVKFIDAAFLTSGYDLSNIRVRRETLGGSVYDLGCYCTSLIQTMFEEEPKEIYASASYTEEDIDIHTSVVMEYESGKRASFLCGMCLPGTDERIDRWTIYGTKGYIKSEEPFNGKGELSYILCVDGKAEVKTVKTPHNYKLEVEQLGRCITEGEKPFVSGAFTMANGRTMDRVLEEIHY